MLRPEEREVHACRTCFDFGIVRCGSREIKCPNCNGWDADRRLHELKAETARRAYRPDITVLDLTDDELGDYRRFQIEHPHANKQTILAWIEGRRYDPSKDERLVGLVEARIEEWRAELAEERVELGLDNAQRIARKRRRRDEPTRFDENGQGELALPSAGTVAVDTDDGAGDDHEADDGLPF